MTARIKRHSDRGRMRSRLCWTIVAWVVAIVFFFPVLWMVVTAFKPEPSAYTYPPTFSFHPTLSEFRQVFSRGVGTFLQNSAIATVGSTVIAVGLAAPAAYALSIRSVRKWRDGMFFFISTKMLPIVAAIVPLYVLARDLHLVDNIWVLILLFGAMNIPISVWMMRSFFLEVPTDMLEASRVDGAPLRRELLEIMLPVVAPGVAATALICVIFSWNEYFLALNLTATSAATVPVFLQGFITSEGLYYAKLAAAATLASLPVIAVGWIAQRQLVRGLSMGAIK